VEAVLAWFFSQCFVSLVEVEVLYLEAMEGMTL
jgi:hypothetical protein